MTKEKFEQLTEARRRYTQASGVEPKSSKALTYLLLLGCDHKYPAEYNPHLSDFSAARRDPYGLYCRICYQDLV